MNVLVIFSFFVFCLIYFLKNPRLNAISQNLGSKEIEPRVFEISIHYSTNITKNIIRLYFNFDNNSIRKKFVLFSEHDRLVIETAVKVKITSDWCLAQKSYSTKGFTS